MLQTITIVWRMTTSGIFPWIFSWLPAWMASAIFMIHYIYDSLYLFLTHRAYLKCSCDTCLRLCDTCDTFYLRLSWLVSHSDEEGNIRRMIYADDSLCACLIAFIFFNSADSPALQLAYKFNSSKKPQITLRYSLLLLFLFLPLCCLTRQTMVIVWSNKQVVMYV